MLPFIWEDDIGLGLDQAVVLAGIVEAVQHIFDNVQASNALVVSPNDTPRNHLASSFEHLVSCLAVVGPERNGLVVDWADLPLLQWVFTTRR